MENGIIMGFQETMGNKGEKRSSAISPKPYVLTCQGCDIHPGMYSVLVCSLGMYDFRIE